MKEAILFATRFHIYVACAAVTATIVSHYTKKLLLNGETNEEG